MATRSMKKRRGAGLLELIVTCALVACLTAYCISSFSKHLLRVRRMEARVALLRLQVAQEKFHAQYNRYSDDVTGKPTAQAPGLGLQGVTENGLYRIEVTEFEDGGQAYEASATPRAGSTQPNDLECGTFTIDERGVRGNSTGPGRSQNCWK